MKKSLIALIAIAVVAEFGLLSASFLTYKDGASLAEVLPAVIAALTNSERQTNNTSPLVTDKKLGEAARLKAEDMATRGYFAHNTPEGFTPWYWLQKAGYQYTRAGENLAVNFTESKDVVDAWMDSPTHRANIIKQTYTEIGVGMATGTYQGRPAIFIVEFFGTPLNK